ncbi:HNH endonuclease [Streptomyces sp. NPDC051130]|uniref:HNH endonuclease n=1 Tax=Streptomyces sp. NPDC051130 TaxID=3157223 RepID=UPI0034400ECE
MTPRGPYAPLRSVTNAIRPLSVNRPSSSRLPGRVVRITPVLRAPERPHGPSRHAVFVLWEEEDVWSCAYCDGAFGSAVVAEVDHVTPLAKGGLHEWSNLAPACRDCNRLKSDSDITAWLTLLAGGSSAECDAPNTESCDRG